MTPLPAPLETYWLSIEPCFTVSVRISTTDSCTSCHTSLTVNELSPAEPVTAYSFERSLGTSIIFTGVWVAASVCFPEAVSYTHLDVYKRQLFHHSK